MVPLPLYPRVISLLLIVDVPDAVTVPWSWYARVFPENEVTSPPVDVSVALLIVKSFNLLKKLPEVVKVEPEFRVMLNPEVCA